MKRMLLIAVLALAVAPVAASAPGTEAGNDANADCTALQAKLGTTTFMQAYGNFGGCVSAQTPLEQQNVASAQDLCTAEQNDATFAANHGGKTFAQLYGTGNDRNAFGKCVSTKAKASSNAEQAGRPNPAQVCRAARTKMGTSVFNSKYGKNANDRNAFGKCVSATTHARTQSERTAAATCRSEESDSTFASNHGGKSFDQFFGTNDDLSNAFGECVSQHASGH